MSNKNNNQNELVTTDTEATAALHGLPQDDLQSPHSTELEEDADTFELDRQARGYAMPRIKVINADLVSRPHTIERLQFDVERLRTQLSGLDAEINAREQIVDELNGRIADLETQLAASAEEVRIRDRSIRSLEDEIRSRAAAARRLDDKYTRLRAENETLREKFNQTRAKLDVLEALRNSRLKGPTLSHAAGDASASRGNISEASGNLRLRQTDFGPDPRPQDTAYLESNLKLVQGILRDIAKSLQKHESANSSANTDNAARGNLNGRQARPAERVNKPAGDSAGTASIPADGDESGTVESGRLETKADERRVHRVLIGRIDKQLLRFPLFKRRLTIGRTKANDIKLSASSISRRHAVILSDDEATRIVDRDSSNGVYVNSRRVTEHVLQRGDRVRIGTAEFIYEERARRDS